MHEILGGLREGSIVLDLGSREGSFEPGAYDVRVVRLDLEVPNSRQGMFVRADASYLPFPDASFDAVVSNHSLEHIGRLDRALAEIGRVLGPSGALYVAVPDASTFTDHLYRWLAHGGGHVNAFRSAAELSHRIEAATGLPFAGQRLLGSSFAFANRRNERWSRRIALLGWGNESFLAAMSLACRFLDSVLGTRLGVYGWALYFGRINEPICREYWTNVCVRCGAGHAWEKLAVQKRALWFSRYRCPGCNAWNFYTHDEAVAP